MVDIKTTGAKYDSYLRKMRRYFHEHPELSNREYETSAAILKELSEMGIPARKLGGTGVVADIKCGKPGKCVALRADIDALPVCEETGLPFASKNAGVMHACGHDGHIAMLLTACRILNDVK